MCIYVYILYIYIYIYIYIHKDFNLDLIKFVLQAKVILHQYKFNQIKTKIFLRRL